MLVVFLFFFFKQVYTIVQDNDSAKMAGELAGVVLDSYASHNLRKISPTDRSWSSLGRFVFPRCATETWYGRR